MINLQCETIKLKRKVMTTQLRTISFVKQRDSFTKPVLRYKKKKKSQSCSFFFLVYEHVHFMKLSNFTVKLSRQLIEHVDFPKTAAMRFSTDG